MHGTSSSNRVSNKMTSQHRSNNTTHKPPSKRVKKRTKPLLQPHHLFHRTRPPVTPSQPPTPPFNTSHHSRISIKLAPQTLIHAITPMPQSTLLALPHTLTRSLSSFMPLGLPVALKGWARHQYQLFTRTKRTFSRISDSIPDYNPFPNQSSHNPTTPLMQSQPQQPHSSPPPSPPTSSNSLKPRRSTAQYRLLMNLQYLHADLSDTSHLPSQTQQFLQVSKLLRIIGLKESEIIQLAQKATRFFELNTETELQPKLSFLLNVGWSQSQINNLILRQPNFFFQNLHNIAFKFQYLLHLGFKLYEFPYLILAPWGTMSTRDIEARVRWLREFSMTESQVRDAFRVSTRLFTFTVQQLETGVSVLSRAGFPITNMTQIIRRSPTSLQSTTLQYTLLAKTFKNLLGISEDQFYGSFIGRWPHLNYVSPNNTYRLFSFLHSIGYTPDSIAAFLRHQGTCLSIDLHEAAKRIDFLGKELFIPISLPYDRREFQLAASQVLSHTKPLHVALANATNIITLRSNRLTATPMLTDRPNEHEVATIGEVYRLRLLNLITSTQFGRFRSSMVNGENEVALSTGPVAPVQLFASQIKVLKHSQIDDIRLRAHPPVDPEYYNESFNAMEQICFNISQRTLRYDRLYLASKLKQIASLDYETVLQTEYLTTGNVDEVTLALIEDEITASQHSTPPINLIPSHEDKDAIVSSYTTDGTNIIAVLNNRAKVPLKLSLSTIGYKELFVNLGLILQGTRPQFGREAPFPQSMTLFSRQGTFRAYISSKLLTDFLQTHLPANINSHLYHDLNSKRFTMRLEDDDDFTTVTQGPNSLHHHHHQHPKNTSLIEPQDITHSHDVGQVFPTESLFEQADDGSWTPKDRRLIYLSQSQPIKKIPSYTFHSSLPITSQLNFYNSDEDFSTFQQQLAQYKDPSTSPIKQVEFSSNMDQLASELGLNLIPDEFKPDFHRFNPTSEELQARFPRHFHHIRGIKRQKARQDIIAANERLRKLHSGGKFDDEEGDLFNINVEENKNNGLDGLSAGLNPYYGRPGLNNPSPFNALSLDGFQSKIHNRPVLDIMDDIEQRIEGILDGSNNSNPSTTLGSKHQKKQSTPSTPRTKGNKKAKSKHGEKLDPLDSLLDELDEEFESGGEGESSDDTSPLSIFDSEHQQSSRKKKLSASQRAKAQFPIGSPMDYESTPSPETLDSYSNSLDELTPMERFQRKLVLNNVDLWLDPPNSAKGYVFSQSPVSLTTADFDTLSSYVVHIEQHMPHLAAMENGFLENQDSYHKNLNNSPNNNNNLVLEDEENKLLPTASQFYPGLAPTLPSRKKRRFFAISKAEDRRINRNYPSYNVLLDYVDGATDLFNPQHMSLINASLPEAIAPLSVRPLPFRDLVRQPRSAKEWAESQLTMDHYNHKIKVNRGLSTTVSNSRMANLGVELMYNNRVKVYPSLYYFNRAASHQHLLDVHLPRVRVDDPKFSFITEVTHNINEHLALLTRLRLILQDRRDFLENRADGPGRGGLSFLNDLKYFFAHLSRVEWTLQKLLHTIQQHSFDLNRDINDGSTKTLFKSLIGQSRFEYYQSQLTDYTYFSDYTRSKSWFLLYDPYKNLSTKIAGFHALYSVWASISSRLSGLHPFRTSSLYVLRHDDPNIGRTIASSRRVELADISMVASTSSLNFLNTIPGSPHSLALAQIARSPTTITTSFNNRLLPRSSNHLLRAMGYTLDPRQVLWDAADRGVKPNTEKIALKHHITKRRAMGDIETIKEKKASLKSKSKQMRIQDKNDDDLDDDNDDLNENEHQDANQSDSDHFQDQESHGSTQSKNNNPKKGKIAKQPDDHFGLDLQNFDFGERGNSDDDNGTSTRLNSSTNHTKLPTRGKKHRSNELYSGELHLGNSNDFGSQEDKGKKMTGDNKRSSKKSKPVSSAKQGNNGERYTQKPRYHRPELQSLDDWCNEVQDWAISKNPFQVPPLEIIDRLDLRDDSLVLELDPETGESHVFVYWHNKDTSTTSKRVHGIQSLEKQPKFFSPDTVQLNVEDPFFRDFTSKIWPSTYGEYVQQFKIVHRHRPDIPITPSVQHHDNLQKLFSSDTSAHTLLSDTPVSSAAVLLESSTSGNVLRQIGFEEHRVKNETLLRKHQHRVNTNIQGGQATKSTRSGIMSSKGRKKGQKKSQQDEDEGGDRQSDDDDNEEVLDQFGEGMLGEVDLNTDDEAFLDASPIKPRIYNSNSALNQERELEKRKNLTGVMGGEAYTGNTPIPMWYRLEFPEMSLQAIATAIMSSSRDPTNPSQHIHHSSCSRNPVNQLQQQQIKARQREAKLKHLQEENKRKRKGDNKSPDDKEQTTTDFLNDISLLDDQDVNMTRHISQDIDWAKIVRRNQYLHLKGMQSMGLPYQHLHPNARNFNLGFKDSNQLSSQQQDSLVAPLVHKKTGRKPKQPSPDTNAVLDSIIDAVGGNSSIDDDHIADDDSNEHKSNQGDAANKPLTKNRSDPFLVDQPAEDQLNSLAKGLIEPQDLLDIREEVTVDDVKLAIAFHGSNDLDTFSAAQEIIIEQYVSPESNNTTNPIKPKKKIYRPICWCCALQIGVGWWNHPPGNSQEYAAGRRSIYYYNSPNIDVDSVLSQLPDSNPLVIKAKEAVGPDYLPPVERFDDRGYANVNTSLVMSFGGDEPWFDQTPSGTDLSGSSDPSYWSQNRSYPHIFMDMQRDMRAISNTIYRAGAQDWDMDPFPKHPHEQQLSRQHLGIGGSAKRHAKPHSGGNITTGTTHDDYAFAEELSITNESSMSLETSVHDFNNGNNNIGNQDLISTLPSPPTLPSLQQSTLSTKKDSGSTTASSPSQQKITNKSEQPPTPRQPAKQSKQQKYSNEHSLHEGDEDDDHNGGRDMTLNKLANIIEKQKSQQIELLKPRRKILNNPSNPDTFLDDEDLMDIFQQIDNKSKLPQRNAKKLLSPSSHGDVSFFDQTNSSNDDGDNDGAGGDENVIGTNVEGDDEDHVKQLAMSFFDEHDIANPLTHLNELSTNFGNTTLSSGSGSGFGSFPDTSAGSFMSGSSSSVTTTGTETQSDIEGPQNIKSHSSPPITLKSTFKGYSGQDAIDIQHYENLREQKTRGKNRGGRQKMKQFEEDDSNGEIDPQF